MIRLDIRYKVERTKKERIWNCKQGQRFQNRVLPVGNMRLNFSGISWFLYHAWKEGARGTPEARRPLRVVVVDYFSCSCNSSSSCLALGIMFPMTSITWFNSQTIFRITIDIFKIAECYNTPYLSWRLPIFLRLSLRKPIIAVCIGKAYSNIHEHVFRYL